MVGNAVWPKSARVEQLENQTKFQADPEQSLVSIVIAARNNGQFLTEAIESALNQSVECEVIYVDDCSFDNSLKIADQYKDQGLQVIRSQFHRGVCEARNRGASFAKGDYLLFLDGDDILQTDYVQKHLDAITPLTPFVYGSAEAFGAFTTFWDAPDWDEGRLWLRNFVNTSALWNRHAFETAGGWRNKINTMWDWDLALRGARLGVPAKSQAVLLYRQHPGSWSANIQTKKEERQESMLPRMRQICTRLSVGSIISGRLVDYFPQWMSAVAQAVKLINTQEPVELVLLDNSNNPRTLEQIRREAYRYLNIFESIRIVPHPVKFHYTTERDRRNKVAQFMAHACNRLKAEMRGEIHWIIEDDILVPLEAGKELSENLMTGWIPPNAVSGCYRSRHVESQFVGGYFDGEHIVKAFKELGDKITSVDYCGTGCLMYWKDRTPQYWRSHYRDSPAHDWAWCAQLKRENGEILMLPSVHCGHVQTPENILY